MNYCLGKYLIIEIILFSILGASCSNSHYRNMALSCDGSIVTVAGDDKKIEIDNGQLIGVRIENGTLSTSGNLQGLNVTAAKICDEGSAVGRARSTKDEFIFFEKGCATREAQPFEIFGTFNYLTRILTIRMKGGVDGYFKCSYSA